MSFAWIIEADIIRLQRSYISEFDFAKRIELLLLLARKERQLLRIQTEDERRKSQTVSDSSEQNNASANSS